MKGILKKIVSSWRKNISQYISRYVLRLPKYPVKRDRRKRLAFGFTLIELLVAALIASLLVSVLLGFLIGVLDSDRKETAKSNAQEELQAAISYISDDLQEAIYIYGAGSLAFINSQLPHTQVGVVPTCNPTGVSTDNTCTPILVFWKRYNFNPNATGKYTSTGTSEVIGCMPYSGDTTILAACKSSLTNTGATFGRDTYTYSLVAYYLKNDTSLTGNTWSNTARILRWELKDGYSWYCGNKTGSITSTTTNGVTTTTPSTGCPTNIAKRATFTSPLITSPVALVDNTYYFIVPDKGFTRPDFASAGTLSSLAAGWKKFDNFNFSTNPFTTLVDFMDDTALEDVAYDGNNTTKEIKIPIGANTVLSNGITTNSNCDDPSIGVGNTNPASATNLSGTVTQRIPANFFDATTNPSSLTSFYACVAPENVTVRLYMRGNAIARLATPVVSRSSRKPTANNLTFFPTADVRSFGRSGIGLKN